MGYEGRGEQMTGDCPFICTALPPCKAPVGSRDTAKAIATCMAPQKHTSAKVWCAWL